MATGFVTYVSATAPVLMHCYGWEDYSDGYDDYAVMLSRDNGQTWSKPEVPGAAKWCPRADPLRRAGRLLMPIPAS